MIPINSLFHSPELLQVYFFIAKDIKGLRNFFLIFKCKGIRMIEIS